MAYGLIAVRRMAGYIKIKKVPVTEADVPNACVLYGYILTVAVKMLQTEDFSAEVSGKYIDKCFFRLNT